MHPDALNAELTREPFIPFRVHLSDGRTLEVHNPGLTYIYGTTFYLLEPFRRGEVDERTRKMRDTRVIALRHIVSVEPIESAAA